MKDDACTKISPQEFIDSTTMSRRQRLIVFAVFLVMVGEGLDNTVVGFVYPQVVNDWGVPISSVTFTVTIGVIAMAVGAVFAGPLADRWGRKGIGIVGIIMFGVSTAAMGAAANIEILATLRVLACLGLGAVAPIMVTIVADSVPARRRAQMVTLSFSGLAVGTVLGGILASSMISTVGWPAMLVVCGLIPIALVPMFAFYVPESVSILISRKRPIPKIRRSLELLAPNRDLSMVDMTDGPLVDQPKQRVGAVVLSRQYLISTLILWFCYAVGMGVVFLLLNYMPLMIESEGFNTAETGLIVGMFGWGGIVGQLIVSFALKRFDRFRILALLWLLGTLALFVLVIATLGFAGYLVVVFALGVGLSTAVAAIQAIGALVYPQSARATGIGWMGGMGRIGTLVSGLLGGMMLGAGWGVPQIFLALSIVLMLGIVAALTFRTITLRREPEVSSLSVPISSAEVSS